MGNFKFIEDFPCVFANFQPYRNSDHSPMIVKFPMKKKFRVRPFKFVNAITLRDDFIPTIARYWNTHVDGFDMFR